MNFPHPAFLTPVFPQKSFTGTALPQSTTSPRAPPSQPPLQRHSRQVISASTSKDAAKSGKRKAAPPPIFAVDMKGNFVWTLRGAQADDAAAVAALVGKKFPPAVVASFIDDSECCVICEASVKGAKKGEGYSGRVLGAVLVDIATEVRDKEVGFSSGLVKKGELLAVVVDPVLPSMEDVRKKLVLGAMKKLKDLGAVAVSITVPSSEDDKISMLKQCFFKGSTPDGNRVTLKCNLVAENPDPQKKLL